MAIKIAQLMIIVIISFIIGYYTGFGHGQTSAYDKMTDDKTIMDLWKQ